ncbi:MAG TPA: peptidylprolyl isomerase [Dehalococcoidia bacterium]
MAKQRRRRRRGPAELPGRRRAKYPFPLNLLFNVKAFYIFFIVVMIASMGAVGFGSNFGSSSSGGAPIVNIDTTPEPTSDAQQWPEGPPPVIDASTPHVATLKTSAGDIVIDLSTEAPLAVNSFAFLAAKNFYDGTAFFYVDQAYFAQAGDPTCTGDGERICSGLGGPGYTLSVEDSGMNHEPFAVVLAANSDGGEEVHGSQFRILYTPDERLDGKETVFGTVIEGQDILTSLGNFSVCSVSTAADCHEDLSASLIIEDVTVEAA